MPTVTMVRGASFSILAWGDEEHCQVLEFLEKLDEESNTDANRLRDLILRTADHGPTQNIHHYRLLEDKIWEMKAPNGSRIFWFYDANRIIICTHGMVKKKQKANRQDIEKAKLIRQQYLAER